MRTQWTTALAAVALAALLATPSMAWIHDQDQNKIDDRIERVNVEGLAAAFENDDINQRMVIGVFDDLPLSYAIYVGYDHAPTASDVAALQLQSLIPVKKYTYIDYTRAQATFVQIQAIAQLPGVTRVEAVPMMYSTNHWGSRVVRARDSRGLSGAQNDDLFPSVRGNLGLDGTGIVIGVLDTGVNDAPDDINPGYPGHEMLAGKFLGGGNFFSGQPLLNTGLDDSENPQDHGGDSYHGTHVAGSAMGDGGLEDFFTGVAPAARLVDCKVLSDAGAGFGSADGVEWCIHNMDNDWGLTGADSIYAGIDVLNLSLGGLTESDGTDAGSQMMDAAMNAGLVVCIASGNDGMTDYMPSPASSDLAITVGSSVHNATFDRTDDVLSDFSNEGPRDSDGDADSEDEMKPNVVAPGSGIVSSNGDFTTDGAAYHQLSGTSMATPHVAGVAALVLQANPDLTPLEVKEILENTAIHGIPSQLATRTSDPFGVDSNYNPADGWGLVDVYAAALEAVNSTSGVQVVRIHTLARPQDGEIEVEWWTQREFAFNGFNVYRADDVTGSPGAFSQINGVIVPGVGDPVIESDDNRTRYTYVDNDPSLVEGQTYWYQVEWVDTGNVGHPQPPISQTLGDAPAVATVYYHITHNAADNDLTVRIGHSYTYDPDNDQFFVFGESESQADSTSIPPESNTVTATVGDRDLFWSQSFTQADDVEIYLPPRHATPWFLNVTEGGYVNRRGTVQAFSLFANDTPGSETGTLYVSTTTPQPTVEGLTVNMWIPEEGGTTAANLATFGAAGSGDGVKLSLSFDPGSTVSRYAVYRNTTDDFSGRKPVEGLSGPVDAADLEIVDGSVEPGVHYWYWIDLINHDGAIHVAGPVSAKSNALGGRLTVAPLPAPNPVRGSTVFRYSLGADVASRGSVPVQLTLHDLRGRLVRTLADTEQGEGVYEATWDTRDEQGQRVAQGVYYYRFRAGSMVRTAKVTVMR